MQNRLAGLPASIWDGTGDNPYFAYLALADAVLVTADSVSMISEAAATGKPVHVLDLDGGSAKFSRFHQLMQHAGITRPFAGNSSVGLIRFRTTLRARVRRCGH